jgi:hypothetical protein
MLSYEQLDNIADAYNPSLLIIYLIVVCFFFYKHKKLSIVLFVQGFLGLLLTYTILYIDNTLALWPSAEMDYSTHSAFALALIFPLVLNKIKFNLGLIFSFCIYAALMLYQNYHSIMDIVSSTIVFLFFDFILIEITRRMIKTTYASRITD